MHVSKLHLDGEIIALDIGEKRIGVARVNTISKLPEPLDPILTGSGDAMETVMAFVHEYNAVGVVCGLPRGLDGQETPQTQKTRIFASQLKSQLSVPVFMIDEAGTSKEAEQRMIHMKSTSKDSIAAAIIAEDFVNAKHQKELQV